jgi:hypothetical protein
MLDPEGAVLIEGRDAIFDRDEAAAAAIGRRLHELQDRALRRPVVPGREGIRGRGAGATLVRLQAAAPSAAATQTHPKTKRDLFTPVVISIGRPRRNACDP